LVDRLWFGLLLVEAWLADLVVIECSLVMKDSSCSLNRNHMQFNLINNESQHCRRGAHHSLAL
jgi:hypothetical protein